MNEKFLSTTLLLSSLLLYLPSEAIAVPKAAEHEDAPVTQGAQVAKPKPAGKKTPTVTTAKPKPASGGKQVSSAKNGKKNASGTK